MITMSHTAAMFKSVQATLAVTILSSGLASFASAQPSVHVFKAARGISLDVGATKVAGYFMPINGNCAVTLMMGAMPDADGNTAPGVTRIEIPVTAGGMSRVATNHGRPIELSCGTGAKLLTVSMPAQVVSLR